MKCRFLRRGENRSTRGKTSRCREENQQTQPTFDAESENRTRVTLVGGECSHHNATTALQINSGYFMITVVLLSASAVGHEEPSAADSQADNPVANEHPWTPPEITGRGIIPMASEEELEELQDMVDELLNSDGNDNQSGQGRA